MALDSDRASREAPLPAEKAANPEPSRGTTARCESSLKITAIPEELRAMPQWVAWHIAPPKKPSGKPRKIPVDPTTGRNASATDPATWGAFDAALERLRADRLTGIGFVFTKDAQFVGIDLDECRDPRTAEIGPWAQAIIAKLASYTEVSPSGTGVHVMAKGNLPAGGRKRGKVEMYDSGRFFTVTGDVLPGSPSIIEERSPELAALHAEFLGSIPSARTPGQTTSKPDLSASDEELIKKASAAENGAKFEALWRGDHSAYPSQSEADLALCGMLAFWTEGDAERMDRMFRSAGLMREKWDERRGALTYGERTIAKALEGKSEFYSCSKVGGDGADDSDGASQKQSPTEKMIDLATASRNLELFHTPGRHEGEPYATVVVDGHRETWHLRSRGFQYWLVREFRRRFEKSPPAKAVDDALTAFAGIALYDGPEHPVAVRLADFLGEIWFDLGDDQGRAVQITVAGWHVVESDGVPVRFVRRRGMLPIPGPERGGSLEELRPLLNLPDDESWRLYVAFLVACLRPRGPYPILDANGEQGTGKSFLIRLARLLIDPNKPPLRRPPREERDLMIAATNSWILAFDNLSGIPPWLSDALCSLATGGGFSTRELYTDAEEKLFDAMRPVMVNGIEDLATRSDFLDRCIILRLPVIPEDKRRDEAELLASFEAIRPRVLGALLDAVSSALRRIPSVKLPRKPRMADFAMWVTAAEPSLGWQDGAFLAAYTGNREEAHELALEASPVGPSVLALMQETERWEGSAKDLLKKLEDGHADQKTRERKDWPKNPRAMRGAIDRVAPNLRAMGLEVTLGDRDKSSKRTRLIVLNWGGRRPSRPSEPSGSPASTASGPSLFGRSSDGRQPAGPGDRPTKAASQPPQHGHSDGVDGSDGRAPASCTPGAAPDDSPAGVSDRLASLEARWAPHAATYRVDFVSFLEEVTGCNPAERDPTADEMKHFLAVLEDVERKAGSHA